MKRVSWVAKLVSVGCVAIGASMVGCFFHSALDCTLTGTCADGSGASGDAGGGGGTPAACVPSGSGAPVDDGCGVFVAKSGKDTNTGTKASPVATLGKAVALAAKGSRRVYACAEMFEEAAVLDGAVEMYGGLECGKGWAYVGGEKRTTLTAGADAIPLVMKSGARGAQVTDFAIHAADAVKEGGSSIAVLADGAMAELVRCELVAGSGAKGAAGTAGDPNGIAAMGGLAGNGGKDACSALPADATVPGGIKATNNCGPGDVSVGGSGGDGDVLFGGGGEVGQTGTKGQAGTGEPSMGAWDCDVGGGKIGASGDVGAAGLGAAGFGAISASGYAGMSGGTGTPGKAGQGGGGGGGAKGGMICVGGVSGSGASGGSGGAGGCGGFPGTGGGPGGASIALVSLKASMTLTDCTLTAGKGGDGGAGGDLQPGGSGGDPGKGAKGVGGSSDGCSGGQGGKGGNGGPGGGGLGGPSLGIAYQGNSLDKQGKTVVTPGAPGGGGPGGSVNVAMNAGEAGKVGEEQEFPE